MLWTWRVGLSIPLSVIQLLLDVLNSSPRLRSPGNPPSPSHKYLFFCTGLSPLLSPLSSNHTTSVSAPGARAVPTSPCHPAIRLPHPLARCLPKSHQDLALCIPLPANSAAWQSRHPAPTALPAPGADGGSPPDPSPRPVFGRELGGLGGQARWEPARLERQGEAWPWQSSRLFLTWRDESLFPELARAARRHVWLPLPVPSGWGDVFWVIRWQP